MTDLKYYQSKTKPAVLLSKVSSTGISLFNINMDSSNV